MGTHMFLWRNLKKISNTVHQHLIFQKDGFHTTCISLSPQMKRAGLGGSVGCAVRLETRRPQVQLPPRSATFFRGD